MTSGNGYYDDDYCGTCEGTEWTIASGSVCNYPDGAQITCGGSGEIADAGNWEQHAYVCN